MSLCSLCHLSVLCCSLWDNTTEVTLLYFYIQRDFDHMLVAQYITHNNQFITICIYSLLCTCSTLIICDSLLQAWKTKHIWNDIASYVLMSFILTFYHIGPLKVHYTTFYGPVNKQRDRAHTRRHSSLQELTWHLDVL